MQQLFIKGALAPEYVQLSLFTYLTDALLPVPRLLSTPRQVTAAEKVGI